MKNEKGVTLVEIMSCLMILSVLGGAAMPMLENFKSRFALREEVSNLVEELHRARSLAIKNNSHVAFSYTETGYITFIDDGQDGGIKDDWVQQPGEMVLAKVDFDNRLKILLNESTFTCQRTRFSRSPGIKPGTVVIKEKFGNSKKVVINSIGRVRIEQL